MSDCKLVLVKEDVRFVVETGMQGPPGKSTYDLAVREGYSGTLQDWLTEQGVADIQLFQDSVDDLQQDLSQLDQTKANDADISDVGKSGQYSDLLNTPSEFTPASHTHIESDITDLDKYTKDEVDNLLQSKVDKGMEVIGSPFTAEPNKNYFLTTTGTVQLPTSAQVGDVIMFDKLGGTVRVNGEIVYDGYQDSFLEWDLPTSLGLVWNGSAWSIKFYLV